MCCVTAGSSGHKHPPDLSNCQGCRLRQQFRSEFMSRMIFGFDHISAFFLSREGFYIVARNILCSEIINVTVLSSWEETWEHGRVSHVKPDMAKPFF